MLVEAESKLCGKPEGQSIPKHMKAGEAIAQSGAGSQLFSSDSCCEW